MCVYMYSHSKRKHSAVLFFPGASTRYLFRTESRGEREGGEREREKRERKMDILLDVGVRRNSILVQIGTTIAKENKRRIKALSIRRELYSRIYLIAD